MPSVARTTIRPTVPDGDAGNASITPIAPGKAQSGSPMVRVAAESRRMKRSPRKAPIG